MKTQQMLSQLPYAAVAVGVLTVAIAMACGGDFTPTGPNQGKVRECKVVYNNFWPTNGTVTVSAPTECPFHIAGATRINLGMTATVSAGSVLPNQFVQTQLDWKSNVWQTNVATTWNTDDNPWTIVITGTYVAGNAGFDGSNNGYDNLYSQFYTQPGPNPQAIATNTLSYSFGVPSVNLDAPDAAGSGVSFSAHAAITDVNAAAPVSYAWTVNGSPMSGNSADVTLTGPAQGTSMTVGVTTIDANGVTHGNAKVVSACPNNQIIC